MAHLKVVALSHLYYDEETTSKEETLEDAWSDDEHEEAEDTTTSHLVEVCVDKHDDLDAIQKEEIDWLDLLYYSIDMTALNLAYLAETQWSNLNQIP